MAPDPHETLERVRAFHPPANADVGAVQKTTTLLARGAAAFDRRRYDPGHITASALVLSTDRDQVLLVYHDRLERWLQPGGHIEPTDDNVVSAARREVAEETGIILPTGPARLVAVDVHEIPAARGEPSHVHHDLMFAFVADVLPPAGSAEARWRPIGEVPAFPGDSALCRGLDRACGTTPAKKW